MNICRIMRLSTSSQPLAPSEFPRHPPRFRLSFSLRAKANKRDRYAIYERGFNGVRPGARLIPLSPRLVFPLLTAVEVSAADDPKVKGIVIHVSSMRRSLVGALGGRRQWFLCQASCLCALGRRRLLWKRLLTRSRADSPRLATDRLKKDMWTDPSQVRRHDTAPANATRSPRSQHHRRPTLASLLPPPADFRVRNRRRPGVDRGARLPGIRRRGGDVAETQPVLQNNEGPQVRQISLLWRVTPAAPPWPSRSCAGSRRTAALCSLFRTAREGFRARELPDSRLSFVRHDGRWLRCRIYDPDSHAFIYVSYSTRLTQVRTRLRTSLFCLLGQISEHSAAASALLLTQSPFRTGFQDMEEGNSRFRTSISVVPLHGALLSCLRASCWWLLWCCICFPA